MLWGPWRWGEPAWPPCLAPADPFPPALHLRTKQLCLPLPLPLLHLAALAPWRPSRLPLQRQDPLSPFTSGEGVRAPLLPHHGLRGCPQLHLGSEEMGTVAGPPPRRSWQPSTYWGPVLPRAVGAAPHSPLQPGRLGRPRGASPAALPSPCRAASLRAHPGGPSPRSHHIPREVGA